MMKRCLKLFTCVLAFCCAFAAQTEPRELRELRMADQAILSSLVLSHSTDGRRLCKENKLACIGPAKEEVAIALIGARHTRRSRESLVQMLAYNLDGSVGEDYNCYVLNSAPLIKEQLAAANMRQTGPQRRDHQLNFTAKANFALAPDQMTGLPSQWDTITEAVVAVTFL